MVDKLTHVVIHTDGSCLGNPGAGGWAAKLEHNGIVKMISGGFKKTTNNRMEVFAAVMALSTLKKPCRVDVYTDSRYLCDAVEKSWIYGWVKKGWKKSDKKPVLNKDLWELLLPQLKRHKVSFLWVAGHTGHKDNEEVDTLARAAASESNLFDDPGFIDA